MRIILASSSPRRIELLRQIVPKFEDIPSKFDEKTIQDVETNPKELVEKLSFLKAEEVFRQLEKTEEEVVVIGGDTIVYFEGEFLGKPKNEEDAFCMLNKIQGKENEVYTGLAVIGKNGKEVHSSKTIVTMKKMTEEDIKEYIATKEPLDKAGSYAVQGIRSKIYRKNRRKL